MRQPLVKFLLVLFVLLSSAELFAADLEPAGTPLRKLQRGFLNIVLSPIEISHEWSKEKARDTMPPSWILGGARGAFYMVGRIVAGAAEIVTFPLPVPAGYSPILEPEFPWQNLPQEEASQDSKSLSAPRVTPTSITAVEPSRT